MRKLNILHIVSILSWGGQEMQAMELSKKLSERGHKVIIGCIEGSVISYKAQMLGLPQNHIRIRGSLDIRSIVKLIRIIKKEKIDIIHAHPVGNYWSVIVAGKLTKRKVVISKHLLNPLHNITKMFLNNADRIVTVSQACKEFMLEGGLIKENKISVIYNGVDLARFNGRVSPALLRQDFGLGQLDILIGCVGRMSKGQGELLDLTKDICQKFPQVKFIFVGSTVGNYIRQRALDLGLDDKVIFTGFREDIPEIMADLDIFIFLPSREAFGLVLIEAMASAKPIIASRTGGIPEIVKNNENGLLVPSSDSYHEILSAVEYLINNKEKRLLMGQRGLDIVKKEFSLDNSVIKTENLYYQLLSN